MKMNILNVHPFTKKGMKKNKNNLKSKKSNKNLLLVVFIKIQQV
jgi:hypothetical protein